ncbi:hypothetical protein PLESTB_001438600 [Pleodorina starrii]|uniref:Sugar phosphate transporter domain-containing protein n=1 Tax=Pleodorina starrii TaxID=330485 RepID=A0A9W6F7Z4_9CHLO|nr:hypothetical protein PLESTB_001438600 [Pleodorina starrii]
MSSASKPFEDKASPPGSSKSVSPPGYVQIACIALNVFAACSIVFANKIVFAVYGFKFVTTLTLIHTVFTWVGMIVMCRMGWFEAKKFTQREVAPLALGYVGYVVLNNLSLNLNTVGLYQILKIAITPTVIVLEFFMYRKVQTFRVLLAILVVCIGVAVAAVTDKVAISNVIGVAVGLASVVVTALYQIWAGTKQVELRGSTMQLLLAYTPQATALLAVLAPILDDIGLSSRGPNTVLGFPYSPPSVIAIVISALLGVLVSVSTFLVIGKTSSLTYNVVGHSKTVLILAGGCLLFGESMPVKRLMGIVVTLTGIAWYTYLTIHHGGGRQQPADVSGRAGGERGSVVGGMSTELVANGKEGEKDPLLQKI